MADARERTSADYLRGGWGHFGRSWGAPICEVWPHIDTPVGERCYRCDKPIADGDQGVRMPCGGCDTPTVVAHLDCFLASVGIGSR